MMPQSCQDDTALQDRIRLHGADSLDWPFSAHSPRILFRPDGVGYDQTVAVDPFPCYPHDVALVRDIAALVEERFPIGFPPVYHVLPFEEVSRTNGHANWTTRYQTGSRDPYACWIVLSGKRIPPHPAMTRYLVAHEYGHCVNWWIDRRQGRLKNYSDISPFEKEYAALRNIEADLGYGGLKWHKAPIELIANDFRICVTGVEPDFWPHPGFAHPHEIPAVQAFWDRMVEQHATAEDALCP